MIYEETVWAIMSKNRQIIAKGVPRNRELCFVNEGKARILTYTSKNKAENGFKLSGFFRSNGVIKWMEEKGS